MGSVILELEYLLSLFLLLIEDSDVIIIVVVLDVEEFPDLFHGLGLQVTGQLGGKQLKQAIIVEEVGSQDHLTELIVLELTGEVGIEGGGHLKDGTLLDWLLDLGGMVLVGKLAVLHHMLQDLLSEKRGIVQVQGLCGHLFWLVLPNVLESFIE